VSDLSEDDPRALRDDRTERDPRALRDDRTGRDPQTEARSPTDAGWIGRVERAWRPEPLDAASRARFDARLAGRREAAAGRAVPRWLPAGVVAVALTLAWLAGGSLWGGSDPAPEAEAGRVAAWEWELLAGGAPGSEDPAALPEEYTAIAGAFLPPEGP